MVYSWFPYSQPVTETELLPTVSVNGANGAAHPVAVADPAAEARATLIARMVADRQLSAMDADALARLGSAAPATEEEILQWLAEEYGLAYTALENSDPDRSILSRFPARVLLREEMLPLREENGHVEVALSRLFARARAGQPQVVHRPQAPADPRA